MRKLILVRHSLPEIVPDVEARHWRLSDVGRQRCVGLAQHLASHNCSAVVTSTEPKAKETGQIIAQALSIPIESVEGLHEHDRQGVQFFGDTESFQATVARLLEQPGELVFGRETGDQARQRFAHAIESQLECYPSGNLVVVAHGTVITLFVAHATGLDPVPFWKQLGLPAFVALSLPDLDLLQVVNDVEHQP